MCQLTMCQFLVYRVLFQPSMYLHTFLFMFCFIISHYRILDVAPCAAQWKPVVDLFYI